MKSTGFALLLLVLLAGSPVFATEIFHWVDENGVEHFSQSAPLTDVAGVSQVNLEDTTPPDFDPEEDRYGIQAQAERMASLRDEMAEKREARRQRERSAPQQPVVQYREPYYVNGWYQRPPYRPHPPIEPELPIAVPYETATFRPPGSGRN
jgi:hypothetical protein